MRRHSSEHESLREHVKSILISPTRKLFHLAHHHNHDQVTDSKQRTRRFSVPDKKSLEISDNIHELKTIDEVSVSACAYQYKLEFLLYCFYLHAIDTVRSTFLYKNNI